MIPEDLINNKLFQILLGKGYPTIPSINNKQLSAQLHYDYHFCKVQSKNKEQRHIDDLLADSLVTIITKHFR